MDLVMRTDRLGLLLDQLDSSLDFSRDRLAGLGDEEYLWEPVPGCWSLRPRPEATTPQAYGAGDWVLDFGGRPDPAPVTTIAWRIGHLLSMFNGRWEWTFGSRRIAPEVDTTFTPVAAEALDQLWTSVRRWSDAVAGLTDEQLDTVGFGQFPRGLDPQLPIISIVWWVNREFIHHAAEVALLRDLHRWRVRPDSAVPAR